MVDRIKSAEGSSEGWPCLVMAMNICVPYRKNVVWPAEQLPIFTGRQLALRRDRFVLECCERLLHQNKLAAFGAHQITCLLSVMGLNYRGRLCHLHTRRSHMDGGRVRLQSCCLCVVCYWLPLLQLQVSVTSREVLTVSTGSGAS